MRKKMEEDENEEISLTASDSADGSDARGEMSFFEHLEELRSTLIACIAAFFGAGTLALVFSKQVFALLRLPLEWANVPVGENQALVVMRFMDTFSILLYIALLGGIVLAGPFVLYRFGKFVAPALTRAERSRLIPFCASASGLFLTGASLAFFWLAPVSIRLPYWLAEQFGLQMNWLAQDYYLFVVALTLFSGLMFEFPLVVVFLQYAGMVSKEALLEKWRWVLSGILVSSVLVSPIGDPVVLLVFSGVLFALYLAAVYAGAFLLKRKIKREDSGF